MPKNNHDATVSAPKHLWLAVFLLLVGFVFSNLYFTHTNLIVTRIGNSQYYLEKAVTNEQRVWGLSGRKSLPKNHGMVFVFDRPSYYCFWMKDTHIPLDMIWFNQNREIVHIESNVSPESYPKTFCPDKPAQFVIELNAGEAQKQNLQKGSVLKF